ncbi:hypothetical protein [Paenibacillus camelliae]|uniref:hypothetical protein n=1 Tax=Paenibacillus camelliae TaxID=512410 RepID=UPI00203A50E9|nr:hypothetical protein [Paenibacillus camelliae]MCM3632961.1 hypothetical protein [Paenibacillus camelliae]
MRKVKITRFDKFMLLTVAYGGLGLSLYSLIRKSTYSDDLLSSMIGIILSISLVLAVHHGLKKHRSNNDEVE